MGEQTRGIGGKQMNGILLKGRLIRWGQKIPAYYDVEIKGCSATLHKVFRDSLGVLEIPGTPKKFSASTDAETVGYKRTKNQENLTKVVAALRANKELASFVSLI